MSENLANKYDIIVIGSGIGGLASAGILAKMFGKKVLVLEQHRKLGGFTHDFGRKKYHWDVGVHYVGDISSTSFMGKIFKYVAEDRLEWKTIPKPYDTHVFPDIQYQIGEDWESYEANLIRDFPSEEMAIKKYIQDLHKVANWQQRYNKSLILPPSLYWLSDIIRKPGSELALMTTQEYLDQNFTDEKIKGALVSSWGNYGVLPNESSFFIHCMNVIHFFNGAYYPVGGAGNIAKSIQPTIERNGGKCLTAHSVVEIITENGTAIGVKAKYIKNPAKPDEGEEKVFYADQIISDTGVHNTYLKLLNEETKKQPTVAKYIDEIKNFTVGRAHVNLFLGLKNDLTTIGLKGGNLWISDKFDHNQVDLESSNVLKGKIQTAFMSSPSMRDKDVTAQTAEIITFVDYKEFKKWEGTKKNERPEDYNALKEKMAKAMIYYLDKYCPGFADLVDFYEISTPITTVYYNQAHLGAMYGLASVPERYKVRWGRPYTPVKNLYLTGADIGAHSVVGALSGGLLTAGVSQGITSFYKILKELDKV